MEFDDISLKLFVVCVANLGFHFRSLFSQVIGKASVKSHIRVCKHFASHSENEFTLYFGIVKNNKYDFFDRSYSSYKSATINFLNG